MRMWCKFSVVFSLGLFSLSVISSPQQPLQPLPPSAPNSYLDLTPRYYVEPNRFEQPPRERLNRRLKKQWREIRTFNFGDTECVVISENNIQCGKRFW